MGERTRIEKRASERMGNIAERFLDLEIKI
jgi:hypothetical protein